MTVTQVLEVERRMLGGPELGGTEELSWSPLGHVETEVWARGDHRASSRANGASSARGTDVVDYLQVVGLLDVVGVVDSYRLTA